MRYGFRLIPVASLGLCVSCEHASFVYHEDRPRRDVHVIEHRPVQEVHVVEPAPVREVHVHHAYPVTEVHVHKGHVCAAGCDHHYDGGRWLVVGHGHRHGPGCGHVLVGGRWTVDVHAHKGRATKSAPPRKYRNDD